MSLRIGIAAGIGLFLALIGLKSAGIVVAKPCNLSDLRRYHRISGGHGCVRFFLIIAMVQRGMKSAVILSILIITGLGISVW